MSILRRKQLLSASLFCWLFLFAKLAFAETTAGQFANSVVRIDTIVISNGRTVEALGAERSGSGVIIDANGLLVTAGYLLLEAESIQVTYNNGHMTSAELIANDHASGLALLKTSLPADFSAMAIGRSSATDIGEEVLVLSHGGVEQIAVVTIADIREFSAAWEYHIDRAIYTKPVYPLFSGAALINTDAELIGIGSLLLSDISSGSEAGRQGAGNVFIPIEYLTASLGELLVRGRSSSSQRAWLGVYLAESEGDLRIVRLANGGPAEIAGLQLDDSVIAIDGQRVQSMAAFYKQLWSSGEAGGQVELLLSSGGQMKTIAVTTVDRQGWLNLSIE